jgi:hypothetical protein
MEHSYDWEAPAKLVTTFPNLLTSRGSHVPSFCQWNTAMGSSVPYGMRVLLHIPLFSLLNADDARLQGNNRTRVEKNP